MLTHYLQAHYNYRKLSLSSRLRQLTPLVVFQQAHILYGGFSASAVDFDLEAGYQCLRDYEADYFFPLLRSKESFDKIEQMWEVICADPSTRWPCVKLR